MVVRRVYRSTEEQVSAGMEQQQEREYGTRGGAAITKTNSQALGVYVMPTLTNLLVWEAVVFRSLSFKLQGASLKLYQPFIVCRAELLLRAIGSRVTTRT